MESLATHLSLGTPRSLVLLCWVEKLLLRCCSARFAGCTSWELPVGGHSGALRTSGEEEVGLVDVVAAAGASGSIGGCWTGGAGGGWKRIRLTKKTLGSKGLYSACSSLLYLFEGGRVCRRQAELFVFSRSWGQAPSPCRARSRVCAWCARGTLGVHDLTAHGHTHCESTC